MRTRTTLSREHEIKSTIKFTWSLEEYKNNYSCRTMRTITIYINNKEILTTKPLSIKTITEITKSVFFARVIFILCRERKFKDEHRKVVDLIKNIINY